MEDKFGEIRKKQKSTKVEKQEKTGGPNRGHLNNRNYRKNKKQQKNGGEENITIFQNQKLPSCQTKWGMEGPVKQMKIDSYQNISL